VTAVAVYLTGIHLFSQPLCNSHVIFQDYHLWFEPELWCHFEMIGPVQRLVGFISCTAKPGILRMRGWWWEGKWWFLYYDHGAISAISILI
jgi:hypothetical protein